MTIFSANVAFIVAMVAGGIGIITAITATIMGIIWIIRYKEDPTMTDVRYIRQTIDKEISRKQGINNESDSITDFTNGLVLIIRAIGKIGKGKNRR